jgi:hypothetical protein
MIKMFIVVNAKGQTKEVSESVAKNAMVLKMSGYKLVGEVTKETVDTLETVVQKEKPTKQKGLNLQEKSINK